MDLRSLVAGWHDGENWLGPWLRDSLQGERERRRRTTRKWELAEEGRWLIEEYDGMDGRTD